MTRIDMTTREWHELIRPVLPHAINDKDFPELDVIRLELGETALYAVATDRYKLAAERWPLTGPGLVSPGRREAVHLAAREVSASLKLFTHSKDDDPVLSIMIDEVPTSVTAVGQLHSVMRLGVTVQQLGDGTRLVLHDIRDPSRDLSAAGGNRSARRWHGRPAARWTAWTCTPGCSPGGPLRPARASGSPCTPAPSRATRCSSSSRSISPGCGPLRSTSTAGEDAGRAAVVR